MIDTLEKKINGQTRHLDVLNSKQNQNFGTILHNCVSSVIWTWFFYFLGIVRIVTNQHFMLECKVEVDDCRLFPQQGDMELTEDDRNNLSEMDNEFGEELNDEWGMENFEEFQGQTRCNSSRLENLELLVPMLLITEALCIVTLHFEERNRLFITRTSFLFVRNRLASYKKLVFVMTTEWR